MKTKKELKEGAYSYTYRLGYEHCKEDVLKLIDEWREKMRDKIFKWGIEEGGDKLYYNEIADEEYEELKSEIEK